MKILFQIPSVTTLYAGRTIYNGYKHAFEDLGHTFNVFTLEDNPKAVFDTFSPDIFLGGFGPLAFKYMDFETIKKHKKRGMKVFANLPFWKSPISKLRVNETPSISENNDYIALIQSGRYGDIYYNVCEEGDMRMDGFEKVTGYKHITIPLAADKKIVFPEYSSRFVSDIAYIGTNLPNKRSMIKEQVTPLKKKYDVKIYGQDWSLFDRSLGLLQKAGQYFSIPILASIRKPKLNLEDERRIYSSSLISINIHEEYQRKFGGDCNERTFKIPLSGGFEVTDDVACIRKYFKEDEEIVITKNKNDWMEKIEYYITHPEKRLPIVEAGRKRVLKEHTYHNRVKQIIALYEKNI